MKKSKILWIVGLCLPLLFACGDDNDSGNKDSNSSGTADDAKKSLIIGKWCTTHLNGYITDMDGNKLETWNHDAVKGDMDHLNRYKEIEFTSEGRWDFWSQNENGSPEIRGRLEKTMVGKWSVDGDYIVVTDIIEGYHNVKDYEEGKHVAPSIPEMRIKILGLSATSCDLLRVQEVWNEKIHPDGGGESYVLEHGMGYETMTFKKM
ncbi:MAG: hypothetical protein K5778_06485 [Bacteroidaceae bacterium]|nr:hypothetical protein [Bacteroidaceae bacterium]